MGGKDNKAIVSPQRHESAAAATNRHVAFFTVMVYLRE